MVRHQKVIKALREAYREAWQPTMKFFSWCAKQPGTPRETDVESLQTSLKITPGETSDLVSGIIETGIGKRIVGRRGHKSRIQWQFTLDSIAKMARGDTEILVEVGDQPFSSQYLVESNYQLRDDEEPIVFKLPRDLTRREAERLALFINSLPRD